MGSNNFDNDNFGIMFQPTITNEEIAQMPPLAFGGTIVLIEDEAGQQEAAKILSKCTTIGFDTESRAVFKKGQKNQIALLQLSTERVAFLIRLNKTPLSRGIVKILQSRRVRKVGVAVRDDIKDLQALTPFHSNSFIDLQKIVGDYGIHDISLKKISAIVMGGRVSKAQRLSNWSAQILTPVQMEYAATDAWVSLEIYNKLIKANKIDDNDKDIPKKG